MELYVLDDQLRRIEVIDTFQSLIWTERFSASGDFQLIVDSNSAIRNLLPKGTLLSCNKSYRVMRVDQFEDKLDGEGRPTLTVTGPSLEDILKDRVAKETLGDLTTDPDWSLTGTPSSIIRDLFSAICVDGDLDPADIIPFITEGSFLLTPGAWAALPDTLFWADAIGYWEDAYDGYTPADGGDDDDDISVTLTPADLYSTIKQIADAYGKGFRLVRNFDNSELYFEVYSGVDRTSDQNDVDPVLFSYDLDNLSDTTELSSASGSKNVAYVLSVHGELTVFAPDADLEVSGFDRRVLYVDASDITDTAGPTLTAKLQQRGYEALTKYRDFTAFDGEISQYGQYKYQTDYDLGDEVELKNRDGVFTRTRVTEQIMAQDDQGEREYPTLVTEIVIIPGTWGAVSGSLHWADVDDDIYWADWPTS